MVADNSQRGVLGWRLWSTRKKVVIALCLALIVIAIAVGLGVGLTRGGEEEPESPPTTGDEGPVSWKPAVGSTWQIQLLHGVSDTSYDVDIYDIDLFDNDKAVISDLQKKGRKVICYFSAGSYEDWRSDANKFKESDMGRDLDGWQGEKWLDVRSTNVRNIMLTRLDMAKEKNCDGVDPDNVDAYDNNNGLDLTEDDAVNFVSFLANATHSRGMSLGLKNAGAIIPSVIGQMQWSVNEQCAENDECDEYRAFIDAQKPVFHIEYPKGENTNDNIDVSQSTFDKICDSGSSRNFSTVIKNMDLDAWVQPC